MKSFKRFYVICEDDEPTPSGHIVDLLKGSVYLVEGEGKNLYDIVDDDEICRSFAKHRFIKIENVTEENNL